jgi:hypothetical protein
VPAEPAGQFADSIVEVDNIIVAVRMIIDLVSERRR